MRHVLAMTALSLAALASLATSGMAQQPAKAEAPPTFQPEPFWPKPLPENWILGQVAGDRDSPERQHLDSASPARRWWTTRRERRRTRPRPNAARRHRPSWSSTLTEICCATGVARVTATSGCRTNTACTSTRTAPSGSAATTMATRSCTSRRMENSSTRSARTTAPRVRARGIPRGSIGPHTCSPTMRRTKSTSRTATAIGA